ncbi:MAG: serine/threonine-protein kinase [Acidobacteriota bacterium]
MLTQVGKYLIEEKVGVGGFGTVYKGRDPFIKRAVAIKTCQSEEEEIKKRFFREAEFAGNLHHRNITTIYDFGVTDDGTPYIVQEFLTGEDLDKLARKKEPLSLKRKLAILIDVCEGLGYAHAAGIIHRDIKPSNVRILEDGTVKLMDFGIAKSMVSQSTLTQTGITLGTASYLAPEQIRGEDLDTRTDLFSLGVLAYELTTGQKPFTGDHISTVLYKIMNEIPAPPSTLAPGLPRALDALVVKLLEKDRTRRYTNCAEVKAELAAVLAGLSSAPEDEAPVDDMDRTVATPSAGYQTGAAPRASSRVLDTPLSPSAPLRQTHGGAADVRLRATGGAPVLPSSTEAHARESGPVLRVLLSAVVVVLAGGGGFWLYVQKKAAKPQPPAPAETSASSVPSPAATTASTNAPTSAPAQSAAVPEPAPSPVPAPPVVLAAEPTQPPAPAGPVLVTFRSNQVATLTIDAKKKGSVPPAGTRFSVEPGKHTAVFEVPGFMTLPPVTFVVDGPDTKPVSAVFPAKGQIVLAVTPPGAEIRIDGVLQKPQTGVSFKKFLVAGPHDIVVSMPGYSTERRPIDLEEESQNTYRIDLKKE